MNKIHYQSLFTLFVFIISNSLALSTTAVDINDIAQSYVKLVLEIGLYEPDYAETFFGPFEWIPAEDDYEEEFPSEKLLQKIDALIESLENAVSQDTFNAEELQRYNFLRKQLLAVKGKIDLLSDKKMSFDEESELLYDIVAPAFNKEYFGKILVQFDEILPGEGELEKRFNDYTSRFTIPGNKKESVLKAAITEYRRRIAEHIRLPENEKVDIELQFGEPWAANLQYKGNSCSVIQVNSSAPFTISDLIGFASHECYPGHHIHFTMLDKNLYRQKKWVEFSIHPMNCPLAVIAEGIAEYGRRDLIISGYGLEFEKNVLFPLAGLNPNDAPIYFQVMELKDRLDEAMIEAARRYLDGKMSRNEANEWFEKYCLVSFAGAQNLLRFIDEYRSYVVNYALGYKLVKNYIENPVWEDNSTAGRWKRFNRLLSTAITPSELGAVNE